MSVLFSRDQKRAKIMGASCIVCFLAAALWVGCSSLTLTIPTSPVFERVGGDVTLNFSLNPSNAALQAVTWTLNITNNVVIWTGGAVSYGQGYEGRAHLNKMTGSLALFRLTLRDSGLYSVSIITTEGVTASGSITLQVLEPVSGIKIKPQPEKPNENEKFSLTCEADHADSFLWMKDGQSLDINGTISLSDKNQTVFFNPLLQSYNGTYTCTASNIVSKVTSNYTLVMNTDDGQMVKSLTTDETVAIAVCCVLLVLAVTALVVFLLMRHRRSSTGASKSSSPTTKPEDALVYSTPTFLKEPGDKKTTQNADPNTHYANISKQPQVQSNTATEYAELRRK